MTKELKWGETPFDAMSREEMRILLCKFYSALNSTRSVLSTAEAIQKQVEAKHPFWGPGGAGGRALAKANQALDPIQAQAGGDEAIARACFRYADDLLFNLPGGQWAICPKCKVMIGSSWDLEPPYGQPCNGSRRGGSCNAVLRRLEWSDLKPEVDPADLDPVTITWEKLVRKAADDLWTEGKTLDNDAGRQLKIISTNLHRLCQIAKGEEPLPAPGARL